jgi:signal recognition particle subunit SRP72
MKRKRRVRGGKEFPIQGEVDPERWLPLRERSYYRPTKSKRRKVGGATQGGTGTGATEQDNVILTANGALEIKKTEGGMKKKKKGRR